MADELVLAVPRAVLFRAGPEFTGFSPDAGPYLEAVLSEYVFLPRRRAEEDESYKQIIPYVAVRVLPAAGAAGAGGPGVAAGTPLYLMYQRTGGGEPRLGRLYSIGVGGHVSALDALPGPLPRGPRLEIEALAGAGPEAGKALGQHPLLRGLRRELGEELSFPRTARLSLLGAINNELSPAGRVHFGLAFRLSVEARRSRPAPVRLRREGPGGRPVNVGQLFSLEEIRRYARAMEGWSLFLLQSNLL